MSLRCLLSETYKEWSEDNAPRFSAALAFYTIFSLAPVLIILVSIAGLVFGEQAAQGQLVSSLQSFMGIQAAETLESILAKSSSTSGGVMSTITGVVLMFVGATGVFVELQDSLNTMWGIPKRKDRGYWGLIADRFSSFVMIACIGGLLLITVLASTVLAAAAAYFGDSLPGGELLWQMGNIATSIVVLTVAFALLFKHVPDARIAWRDVWTGALVTALLFTAGKYLIGVYLGKSSIGSTYGAAGSVILILVWIYYSAMVLFFGAEFTQVFATRCGSRAPRVVDGVKVTAEAHAQGEDKAKEDRPRAPGIARATSKRGESPAPPASPAKSSRQEPV